MSEPEEQYDDLKGSTAAIHGGKMPVPKACREHIELADGDEGTWYKGPGCLVLVKTNSATVNTVIKALIRFCAEMRKPAFAIIATIMLASLIMPANAQSPSGPGVSAAPPAPTLTGYGAATYCAPTPQTQNSLPPPLLSLSLQGNNGFVPWEMSVSYPSGTNDTSSTSHSPQDYIHTDLNEAPGLTTKTLTTSSIDNFVFNVGEHYNFAMDGQVASVKILANNSLVISNWQVPIHGCDLKFQINVVTSIPPHAPSAAELNAPVLNALASIDSKVDSQGKQLADRNQVDILTAGSYQVSIVPNVAIAVVSFFSLLGNLYMVVKIKKMQKSLSYSFTKKEAAK